MDRLRPQPSWLQVHGGRVQQEPDGGARVGVPVPDILRYRQHRFLSDQRFAQDVGEETRRRLVRLAEADAEVGSLMPMPSKSRAANSRSAAVPRCLCVP